MPEGTTVGVTKPPTLMVPDGVSESREGSSLDPHAYVGSAPVHRRIAALLVVSLISSACGGGDDDAATAGPVTAAPNDDDAPPPIGPDDWPMYNRDVRGWRYNDVSGELDATTAADLEVKWRYPREGADVDVGAIHVTPAVVNGYVYFGTATNSAMYKLRPDGTLAWRFPLPIDTLEGSFVDDEFAGDNEAANFIDAFSAILSSPLVTDTAVYFGDTIGTMYALDRFTGELLWLVNTKADGFPGAHPANTFQSSPILVDDMVIIGGGTYEHPYPTDPEYRCCFGRGAVMAFDAATGELVWKYDVGPEPEEFDEPFVLTDERGEHVFVGGPSTSSVWSTPSYDAASNTVFFGTDVHNSPRRPTPDDPTLSNEYSAAVIAVDADTGAERWVTQISPNDVYNNALAPYDAERGLYRDQSIGDTPKVYTLDVAGAETTVVGVGSKNGGFYVLRGDDGSVVANTPIYLGRPGPDPADVDPRTIALPGLTGGLQTGIATDGNRIYTNGIDWQLPGIDLPTAGRVVAIDPAASTQHWRHERPTVRFEGEDLGDPIGSGLAVTGDVAVFTTTITGQLVALDTGTGEVLLSEDIGVVWAGPSISRDRVYVGSGSILFFERQEEGVLWSFGLPGEDEIDAMGAGDE